jgi:PAS domain S-box-containing protein
MTEKKREAPHASTGLSVPFETFFNLAGDGMIVHEMGNTKGEARFLHANAAACAMLGYSPEEIRTLTPVDVEDQEQGLRVFPEEERRRAEQGLCFETVLIRKDGTRFPAEINTRLFDDNDRKIALLSIRDITLRKAGEEALRQSEERFRRYFELGLVGMAITLPGKGMVEVNDEICRILGYNRKELLRLTWADIIHPDELAESFSRVNRIVTGEIDHYTTDKRYIRKDGRIIYATISVSCVRGEDGAVRYFLTMLQDTTGRKLLEDQLLHAMKMEAIGTLAGGVAHDFNNILTVILGLGNVIQMSLEPDDPLRPHIDQILVSADRAADLTQSLLAFSRKQDILLSPHPVADIVESTAKLLKRLLPEDVELKVEVIDRDAVAMLDVAQIDQMLMNLATNARDAMPRGGSLTIRTGITRLTPAFERTHGFGKPGKYVKISVSDTGVGMDERTMARIFDPFFTTKAVGKGTGLGLASVYGIIKQHGGYITVTSAPSQGATFDAYLPVVDTGDPDAAQAPEVTGGVETILVVEDDPDVRNMIVAVLSHEGYDTLESAGGDEALALYREHAGSIGLVIVDVVMPGRNGKEILDDISLVDPGVKAIFVSGYTGDVVLDKGVQKESVDFLQKPLSMPKLLAKVREVLDRT